MLAAGPIITFVPGKFFCNNAKFKNKGIDIMKLSKSILGDNIEKLFENEGEIKTSNNSWSDVPLGVSSNDKWNILSTIVTAGSPN